MPERSLGWRLKFAVSYSIGFLLWLLMAPLGYTRFRAFSTIADTARYHADNWNAVTSGEASSALPDKVEEIDS